MALPITIAKVTLQSVSPYSQSRKHDLPKLKGEQPEVYELRTWRDHMSVKDDSVFIPPFAMHCCLTSAARYSKRRIVGQGTATWTAKFASGIVLFDDISLGIDPQTMDYIDINAHVTGVRGSGKRVTRRFPIFPSWSASFDVHILDPIITQDVLAEMVEIAGLFIGIGRYRPENGGSNGRFQMTNLVWKPATQPDDDDLVDEAA